MNTKNNIIELLKEGFKVKTLKRLSEKQINLLHKKIVKEQGDTPTKVDKIKSDLAQANQFAQQLTKELGEEELNEWGSSDQSYFNKSIHDELGEPEDMPSPFSSDLESAAESAVDHWWDDWEEYQTDRQGLIDNAKRLYLRRYFKDDFNMLMKMFEPAKDRESYDVDIELGDNEQSTTFEIPVDEEIDSSNALAMQTDTGQEMPHDEDDMAPDGMDDDSDNDRKAMGENSIIRGKMKKGIAKDLVGNMKMNKPIGKYFTFKPKGGPKGAEAPEAPTSLGMFEEDNEYAICMDSIQSKYGPKKTWKKNAEKKFDACVSQVSKDLKEHSDKVRQIEENIVSLIKDINKPTMTKKDLIDIIEQSPDIKDSPGTKEAPTKSPTRTKPDRKSPYKPKHKPAPKAKTNSDLPEFLKFNSLNITFKDE